MADVIEGLAEKYFNGAMPEPLRNYLMYQYGSQITEDDCPTELLQNFAETDVKQYIRDVINGARETPCQHLRKECSHLRDTCDDLSFELEKVQKENQCFKEFISWMHLGPMYNEFSDEYFDDPDFELSLYEEGFNL